MAALFSPHQRLSGRYVDLDEPDREIVSALVAATPHEPIVTSRDARVIETREIERVFGERLHCWRVVPAQRDLKARQASGRIGRQPGAQSVEIEFMHDPGSSAPCLLGERRGIERPAGRTCLYPRRARQTE